MKTMKKKEFACVLLVIFSLVYISCSDDEKEKVYYTVTFDADGGSPTPADQRVEAGSTVTTPSANPAKAGYVFLFWHQDGSTAAYKFDSPVNKDIFLRAKWQEEATVEYWQVTWVLNGGIWPADDNHATQVVKGGTLAEPAAPTRDKYTLDGWYKDEALTAKVSFPYDVTEATGNITLYAKWEAEPVEPGEEVVAMVASGANHYFVLKDDGTLHAIGNNKYGQLGTGNENEIESLTQVATGVSAVYAGSINTFIVKTDGSIWGAGYNAEGQLGTGDEVNRNTFVKIPAADNVKEFIVGPYQTHLLKKDGSLWSVGANFYGQLGVGDKINRNTFTATNLTTNVVAAATGSEHSIALTSDGKVWGAGYGYIGCFGTDSDASSFVEVFTGAKAIAAGSYHSLALKEDGTVYTTGDNYKGQLGVGDSGNVLKSFTQAITDSGEPITNVTAIAAGYQCSFALQADGTLWATGNNSYKQLGTGDRHNHTRFTPVASGVKSVSAGKFHTLFQFNDGTSEVWGEVNPKGEGPTIDPNDCGTIHIKVNDTNKYQYITSWALYDNNKTRVDYSNELIATGGSGHKMQVNSGAYTLEIKVSNDPTVDYNFELEMKKDRTITVLYEWVSYSVGYRFTVTY